MEGFNGKSLRAIRCFLWCKNFWLPFTGTTLHSCLVICDTSRLIVSVSKGVIIRNIRYQAYVLSNKLHSVVFCKKYNGAIKINHHVLEILESWAFIWILAKKGFIFYYSKTNFKKENDVIYFVVSNPYTAHLVMANLCNISTHF